MSPIVVQKYGGSSVASPEKLKAVAARIVATRKAGARPVVVVSAMGRTTDALVALATEVSGRPHRREMDMILTAGERISMALLAMAIEDQGCQAVSFTGSQAGIITTTDHNQARIIEVRPIRVQQALDDGKVVIVGGFAGVSTAKEVTTLGRGGSDTTAIALAGALDAVSCDILSDVDGIYSADPAVVSEAHRLDRLAAGEVLELGIRGARVLAPEAVDYAKRHGITLRARSTFEEGPGTLITTEPTPGKGRAVAITGDSAVLPIALGGPSEAVDWTLSELSREGLSWTDLVRVTEGDQGSAELVLDLRNSVDAEARLESIAKQLKAKGGQCRPFANHGTVTVVGAGIAEQPQAWEIARTSLGEAGIAARRMWGTRWGLCAEIPEDCLDEVIRLWHRRFPGLGEPDV